MKPHARIPLLLAAAAILLAAGGDAAKPRDDTAALQSLLSSPAGPGTFAAGGRVVLEPRTYRISDTLLIQRRSVILQGQGVSATDAGGTTLLWTGPPGKPMLRLNQAMHCRIEDLRLAGDSRSMPSAALSFYQAADDVCPTEGNAVRNVFIGPMFGWDADYNHQFTNGILFEGIDVNDDFTCFDNLTIVHCATGIRVGNPMNVGNDFRNIRLYECDTGVIDNSTNTYTNIYQGNCGVNLRIEGGGSVTLLDFKSEGAERLCVFGNLGGNLTIHGGSFQAGAKFAADGIAIDGYTPSPVTVSLEDFGFSPLGLGVPTPVVRLREDPAGAGGRKTFLGYNLVNFSAANLDMAIAGPAAQSPGTQRYIAFTRRGMHASPGSLPAAEFCNCVGPGGTVDLTRYDSPAPPPNPNAITGDLRVSGNLILSGTLCGSALDLGGGRRWTPDGLYLRADQSWTADGLRPGTGLAVKWPGSGGLLGYPDESLRFVGWSVDASGNRRSGIVVAPLKGK